MATMKYLLLSAFLLTACASPTDVSSRPPDPLQPYVDANSSQRTAVAANATADYFSTQLTATVEARNQSATQLVISIQSTQQAIQWWTSPLADFQTHHNEKETAGRSKTNPYPEMTTCQRSKP